jgi:hypothetical protein
MGGRHPITAPSNDSETVIGHQKPRQRTCIQYYYPITLRMGVDHPNYTENGGVDHPTMTNNDNTENGANTKFHSEFH